MSDVVSVALISAGGAIVAALMTQLFAMRSAMKQAERAIAQEHLQWQRNESIRRRKEYEDKIQEFWQTVLSAQIRVVDVAYAKERTARFSDDAIAPIAAKAYAIAIISVPALRQVSQEFLQACTVLDIHLYEKKREQSAIVAEWKVSFAKVEVAIIAEVDALNTVAPEQSHIPVKKQS